MALRRALGALCALGLAVRSPAVDAPIQFLIVSQPLFARVVYYRVSGGYALRQSPQPNDLIHENLQQPSGLALDKNLNRLYVADPRARNVFYYGLVFSEDAEGGLVTDGPAEIAAAGVEASWVTVDGVGNIFFTDGNNNAVMTVRKDRLDLGDTRPVMVYQGTNTPSVSLPGGVAVDNFHVYWANGALGTQVGSVIKGFEVPPEGAAASSAHPIASNSLQATSVCLATTNAFFTGAEQFVYGVKKDGGAVVTITDRLLMPRGCVWDGDGTVYVADKGSGAIFSFAGQMHELQATRVRKVCEVDDPYGVAVMMSPMARAAPARAALGLVVGVAFAAMSLTTTLP